MDKHIGVWKTLIVAIFASVTLTPGSAKGAEPLLNCRPLSAADEAKLRGRQAMMTDIDGVLTQYVILDYGPTNGAFLDQGVAYARRDAALMVSLYHRRGYLIVYMAGRPRDLPIEGRSGCEASLHWLYVNGFPIDKGNTMLLLRNGAPEIMKAQNRGQAMADWMGKHGTKAFVDMIEPLKTRFAIVPRYGYVDSDVVTLSFLKVGVPAANIFSIGNKGMSRLGFRGTNAIVGRRSNPGYGRHIRDYVIPKVPTAKR